MLRLLLEAYLDLSISVFINLTDMEWDDINGFEMYNNVFTVTMAVIQLGLPFFIAFFYWSHVK